MPPWAGPDVWVHGDLHPANVILCHGRLAAIIDFGDLAAGDPATDLAAAWMLFSPEVRSIFRQAAAPPLRPIDDDTWSRARGWALTMNLAWLSMSADDEETNAMTQKAISDVLATNSEVRRCVTWPCNRLLFSWPDTRPVSITKCVEFSRAVSARHVAIHALGKP